MSKASRIRKIFATILLMTILLTSIRAEAYAGVMLPGNTIQFPNGTADDVSQDAKEKDLDTYSIHYDPNEGVFTYGVVGEVGASAKKDTNNAVYRGSRFKNFPADYINLTDADGNPLFLQDLQGTEPYDYTAMLSYAINEEANNEAAGRETYEIRVAPGVYYFKGTLKVWGEFNLNGVYGKTIFVCEKNEEGALFKASSNTTNYMGSITDITFVASGAHSSFAPTQTASDIHGNTLDERIDPVEDFSCFQGMNISWFTLKNCTFSGFATPLRGVKSHMCSHIQDNTFGPCLVAMDGLHFIDCFVHDNYFKGNAVLRDTNPKDGVDMHMDLPLFTTGLGPNLTSFNNNYIENFFYGEGKSDTYGVAYANNTYDRVYGIEFYAPGDAGNAVSQCLFKNNTYSDIAAYFEGLGYTPYSETNTGESAYVIHALSYDHNDNISGKSFNKMQEDNKSYVIEIGGGTTITQCKFLESDMSDTELFRMGYYSNATRDSGLTGTQILDNAYEINAYQKDDIFRDNTNLKNNSMSSEWNAKYFLSKKTSKEACIYYSPNGCIKIDMSCFFDPADNETLGYGRFADRVGADENALNTTVAGQYYADMEAGRNVVYLSDFGAIADDGSSDSMSIQKAFDTIAKTGDILVVEGTYNITTPILLRGDKTYRVVCNGGKTSQNYELVGGGFCMNVQDEILKKTGAFVQDKDDTGKVSGYFVNLSVNHNNIAQAVSCIERKGSVFYQVRFENMHFYKSRLSYVEAAFEECTFDKSLLERGFCQYNPYGIMKKSIFRDSVLRYEYATGSMCDYGIGYTYAYHFTDTDFVNSTMRGNWIEFMQMSNGFRLNGDGNSLYIGNIWDYVWNFQFGRNDMFTGNNLTHCATTSVTNHLAGPDNVPRDKWTTEIKAGNITSMHVSDGVKIVGNVFSDGNTKYTTYFNFDGRSHLYEYNGRTVTYISNARIAGNLTANAAGANEMVQVLCADSLLKENCKNNQIDLSAMAKSYKYIPKNQNYVYRADNYRDNMIPGTLVWLWGEETSSLHYYGEEEEAKIIQPKQEKSLTFDLEYKLENTADDSEKELVTYGLDFAGDVVSSYLSRVAFVSPLNENHTQPDVTLVAVSDGSVSDGLVSDGSVVDGSVSDSSVVDSSVSGNSVVDSSVSGNSVSDSSVSGNSVSGNLVNDNTPSDNPASDNIASDNLVSGNSVSSNSVSGNTPVLYSQVAYLNTEVIKENKSRDNLPPLYMFADTEYINKYQYFNADMTIAMGSNPTGDYPVIIYGQDDEYYYGIKPYLQNSFALRSKSFKMRKDLNGVVYGVNANTGGVVPIEWGTMSKVISTDISSNANNKTGNSAGGNVYFDGTDEEATKDNTTVKSYDTDNLNAPLLGMGIECNYGYSQNRVEVYAILDFSLSYVPTDSDKKLSVRKVSLGSHSIEGMDALAGIMFFNDAWIADISYGVDPDFDREQITKITPGEEEEEVCGHDFTEYIRVKPTCTLEGYDSYICSRCKVELSYEKVDKLPHDYDKEVVEPTYEEDGYTLCTCKVCGHTEKTDYTDKLEKNAPEDLWVSGLNLKGYAYTGKAIKPAIKVYNHDKLLKVNVDYTITYKNNVNVYTGEEDSKKPQIVVQGKGNYKGKEYVYFDILPKNIADSDVMVEDIVKVYNGSRQNAVPVIKWNGKKLVYNKTESKSDFLVEYSADSNCQDIGTCTITVTGRGNYTGTNSCTYTIVGNKLISKAEVTISKNVPYNDGKPVLPTKLVVKYNDKKLKENEDYTVACINNCEVGKATAIITGINAYSGTKKVSYNITGRAISNAKVAGIVTKTYTGEALTQEFTLTYNGELMKAGTDYEYSYTNNTDAGTATIVFTGINRYSGTLKKTFTIKPYNIKNNPDGYFENDIANISVQYVKGGATPDVEVAFRGNKLINGVDYTLAYSNNKAVNDGTDPLKTPYITIKGKGNYIGSVVKTFAITGGNLEKEGITISALNKVYKNKANAYKSVPTLYDSNGKKLVAGKDYLEKYTYRYNDKNGAIIGVGEIPDAGSVIYVEVIGIKNYEGSTLGTTYKIASQNIANAKVSIEDQIYSGKKITITKDDITSIRINGADIEEGGYEIVPNSYKNNIKKGTATVTIRGLGNYGGKVNATFKIKAKKMLFDWSWLFG